MDEQELDEILDKPSQDDELDDHEKEWDEDDVDEDVEI